MIGRSLLPSISFPARTAKRCAACACAAAANENPSNNPPPSDSHERRIEPSRNLLTPGPGTNAPCGAKDALLLPAKPAQEGHRQRRSLRWGTRTARGTVSLLFTV